MLGLNFRTNAVDPLQRDGDVPGVGVAGRSTFGHEIVHQVDQRAERGDTEQLREDAIVRGMGVRLAAEFQLVAVHVVPEFPEVLRIAFLRCGSEQSIDCRYIVRLLDIEGRRVQREKCRGVNVGCASSRYTLCLRQVQGCASSRYTVCLGQAQGCACGRYTSGGREANGVHVREAVSRGVGGSARAHEDDRTLREGDLCTLDRGFREFCCTYEVSNGSAEGEVRSVEASAGQLDQEAQFSFAETGGKLCDGKQSSVIQLPIINNS